MRGPDPDGPDTDRSDPDRPGADPEVGARGASRFRVVLLAVLVLALLVSAGVLIWLLADRRGEAAERQAEREAVLARTDQFVLRLNTYGPDLLEQGRMPAYAERVTEVITPKFAADFEQSGLPIAEQTVAQAGVGRSVKILGAGVESIGTDSATAIVAAALTSSYPDPERPRDPERRIEAEADVLRWAVHLVKVEGAWLVDGYTPVTGTEDVPGDLPGSGAREDR